MLLFSFPLDPSLLQTGCFRIFLPVHEPDKCQVTNAKLKRSSEVLFVNYMGKETSQEWHFILSITETFKMLHFPLPWCGLSLRNLSPKKFNIPSQLSSTTKLQYQTTKVNLGTIEDVKIQNLMLTPC